VITFGEVEDEFGRNWSVKARGKGRFPEGKHK